MHKAPGKSDDAQTKPTPGAGRGLRSPRGSLLGLLERPLRVSRAGLALQVAGFAIGVGLLIWAGSVALSGSHRAGLEQLFSAKPSTAALLLALTGLSVVLNGLIFWVTLAPARRLPVGETVAVNAVASLLTYAPLKMSAVARVALHRKRDGLSYKLIAAWFASVAALTLATLGPIAVAGMTLGHVDAVWWAMAAGGAVAGAGACWIAGTMVRRSSRLDALTLGAGSLLASSPTVGAHVTLRLADIATHTGRFLIAASMLDASLSPAGALLLASTYFLVGAASPAGQLGPREASVVGLGLIPAGIGLESQELASVALLVTASEVATFVTLGLLAAMRLRVFSLMARNTG